MSTGTNSKFPKARTADLITEQVGDELVVYDGESSEAHCLSALASAVFIAADGKTSPADLAAIASRELNDTVDVPAVEQAIAELEDRGLVEVGGISRRGFMQRSAAVGGAAFAATLVTSVATPALGSAASLFSTSFSGLGVVVEVKCGTSITYYGMKWDSGFAQGSAPGACGDPGSQPGNCNWPPTGVTLQSGCLAGTTATLTSGGILISLPSPPANTTYTIVYYEFKCGGQSGSNCPHGGPFASGSQTIPVSC
jgi:hypothetical protein